mgnify:CR=1 FL=1
MEEKYKILIVDDEQSILDMLKLQLEFEGYSVYTAGNAAEALDKLSNCPDIILLDIMMPQMNGLEVLEKIKEKNENQKVIMMTAYSTLDKVLKSHKEGATNYVMKPFDSLQHLEKKIIDILEKH